MTWTWEAFRLPLLLRLWRRRGTQRMPTLDPRLQSAHWRRDLGFNN